MKEFFCHGCSRWFKGEPKAHRGDKTFHSKRCRDLYVERTGDGPEGLKDLLRF